jgi:excisionase family DNA binding protein
MIPMRDRYGRRKRSVMADPGTEQVTFDWSTEESREGAPRVRIRRVGIARAATSPPPAADAEERRLRWLTVDEATAHLGFPSRKALYAAVERGQVPAHKLGRRLRFRRDELDALLSRGR